jgi:hypothetical protein
MISGVPSDLFEQASLIKAARFDRSPSQFTHQLFEATAGASTPVALSHSKKIHDRLGRSPFDTIVADFAAQSLQAQPPRIGGLLGLGFDRGDP